MLFASRCRPRIGVPWATHGDEDAGDISNSRPPPPPPPPPDSAGSSSDGAATRADEAQLRRLVGQLEAAVHEHPHLESTLRQQGLQLLSPEQRRRRRR